MFFVKPGTDIGALKAALQMRDRGPAGEAFAIVGDPQGQHHIVVEGEQATNLRGPLRLHGANDQFQGTVVAKGSSRNPVGEALLMSFGLIGSFTAFGFGAINSMQGYLTTMKGPLTFFLMSAGVTGCIYSLRSLVRKPNEDKVANLAVQLATDRVITDDAELVKAPKQVSAPQQVAMPLPVREAVTVPARA
jgi:hypothetical protein